MRSVDRPDVRDNVVSVELHYKLATVVLQHNCCMHRVCDSRVGVGRSYYRHTTQQDRKTKPNQYSGGQENMVARHF